MELLFYGKLKKQQKPLKTLELLPLKYKTQKHKILWENQTTNVKENSQYIVDNIEKYKTRLDGLRELVPPPETPENITTVFHQKEKKITK